MSTINITTRKPKLPEWVDDALKKLTQEQVFDLAKQSIYMHIKPVENGFEISELLQKQANRISILDTLEHSLWALTTTYGFCAYWTMKERDEILYEDKHQLREKP